MNTVILEIPEADARSLGATDETSARNAKIELAIGMYREGKWGTGKAGKFCGMTRIAFMDLLRDRKVEMPYTFEMLQEDLAHARRSL